MPRRYYAKHAFNHYIDNQEKIKALNNKYKGMIINDAIDYLKKTTDNEIDKITYLQLLTHDVYRFGRKY